VTSDSAPTTDSGSGESSRRQFTLAFAVIAVLFGQPAVVFALALGAPGFRSLLIVAAGTALLAGTLARWFVRRGRSVSRLADFVLALAAIQIALVLLGQFTMRVLGAAPPVPPAAQPAVVLVAYPVAYYLVYRWRPVSPLTPTKNR